MSTGDVFQLLRVWWVWILTGVLILFGAIWGSSMSNKLAKLSPSARWMTQVGGALFVACFQGWFMWFHQSWSFWPFFIGGLVNGLFSGRIGAELSNLWQDNDTIFVFISRVLRLIKFGSKAYNTWIEEEKALSEKEPNQTNSPSPSDNVP